MQLEFAAVWKRVDCLFTPATPITAPRIGETTVTIGAESEDVRLATTRLVRAINAMGFAGFVCAVRRGQAGIAGGAADRCGPPSESSRSCAWGRPWFRGEVAVPRL